MSPDVMVQPPANEVDLIGWQSLAFVHEIPNQIGYLCWYELENPSTVVNPTPNSCFQKRPMKLGMVSLGFTTCPLQLPFSLPPFLLDYSSAVQPPNVWTSGFLAGESSFWGFLRFLYHLTVISPLTFSSFWIGGRFSIQQSL
jgi:hypothetical protein